MSQLLLCISLIITLPVATGAEDKFGVKDETESVIFSLVYDENSTSKILFKAGSDLDSLANESVVVSSIWIKPEYSLYQTQQSLSLKYPDYQIRAPPLAT
jgi:hypothetical protein